MSNVKIISSGVFYRPQHTKEGMKGYVADIIFQVPQTRKRGKYTQAHIRRITQVFKDIDSADKFYDEQMDILRSLYPVIYCHVIMPQDQKAIIQSTPLTFSSSRY